MMQMKRSTLLICAALLFFSGLTSAADFTAKVIAVLDGDTVLIKRANGLLKIRLAEIDAPEKAQTFGETSRRSLSGMVLERQVRVAGQAVDQYGRMVAHLDVDGLDVNAEQIRRGMAWEYSHFHSNRRLVALQEEARQAPRGLWALAEPMPPWVWRKQHPGIYSNTAPVGASSVPSTVSAVPLDTGCGSKKRCAEMLSCEEARRYRTQCGIKTMDGDRDGVPCEKLCGDKK